MTRNDYIRNLIDVRAVLTGSGSDARMTRDRQPPVASQVLGTSDSHGYYRIILRMKWYQPMAWREARSLAGLIRRILQ